MLHTCACVDLCACVFMWYGACVLACRLLCSCGCPLDFRACLLWCKPLYATSWGRWSWACVIGYGGCSRVLLVGVCEHLCMCYVSFTFFFSCFSGYCLSDAIVHSLAFYRSVLTPQLLLHYILIMSLHFCTPCALTACTLTNLVLVAKLRIVTCYGGRSRCHISYSRTIFE